MKYQNKDIFLLKKDKKLLMTNLIDNTSSEPSKFRTKNWVEINDESRGRYNVGSQIKFKTTMLKSSLCDYSDACILVEGKITIA